MSTRKIETTVQVEFWGIDSVGREEIIVSIPNSDYVRTYKLDRFDTDGELGYIRSRNDDELIDDAVQMFHDDLINHAEDALITRKAQKQNPHDLALGFVTKKLLNID